MVALNFDLLGSPFFTNIVLPFVLVFTVVFAILDKTQLLGERKDVNSIIAMIFGLIAVGVPAAMGVLSNLIPVIAVLIIILFAWFLVFGFVGTRLPSAKWTPGLIKTFLVFIGLVLMGVIAWATGLFNFAAADDLMTGQFIQMVLLIGAIVAVIAVVVGGKKEGGEEK